MKKLLLIPFLFFSFLAFAQTDQTVLTFRKQHTPTNSKDSLAYTYPGKIGNYSYFGNLELLRTVFKVKADSVSNTGYVTHGYLNAHSGYVPLVFSGNQTITDNNDTLFFGPSGTFISRGGMAVVSTSGFSSLLPTSIQIGKNTTDYFEIQGGSSANSITGNPTTIAQKFSFTTIPKFGTSSVIGYVPTATNTSGDWAWTALPGGSNGINGLNGTVNIGLGGPLANNTAIANAGFSLHITNPAGSILSLDPNNLTLTATSGASGQFSPYQFSLDDGSGNTITGYGGSSIGIVSSGGDYADFGTSGLDFSASGVSWRTYSAPGLTTDISSPWTILSSSGGSGSVIMTLDGKITINQPSFLNDPNLPTFKYSLINNQQLKWIQSAGIVAKLATATALPANTYGAGFSGGPGDGLTANTNGALTVDGVTVNTNDIILVKNEATTSHNGIYTVANKGSGSVPYVLVRTQYLDFQTSLSAGSSVYITAGSTNNNLLFYQTTPITASIGTNSLTYVSLTSTVGAVTSFNTRTGAVVPVAGDYASLTESLTNKDLTGAGNTFPTSLLTKIGTQSVSNKTLLPANIYQTPAGTAGTDSIVVKNSGSLKAISSTYYQIAGSYQPLEDQRVSTTNSPSFVRTIITGAGGNGYLDLNIQSASPASLTNHLRIYADSLNRISWKNSTYRRTIQVPYPSDYTIRMPYRVTGTTLEDSTFSAAIYALQSTAINNGYAILGGGNFSASRTLAVDSTLQASKIWAFAAFNTKAIAASTFVPQTRTIAGFPLSGNVTLGTLTFGSHLISGGSSYNAAGSVTITSDATSSPTASTIDLRDANGNIFYNNDIANGASTVSSATPIVLTNASAKYQIVTGTTAQTITLPVASTMALFQSFTFFNQSTQVLTIQSSGSNTVIAIPAGLTSYITDVLTTGTTASSWDRELGIGSFTGTGNMVLSANPNFTGTANFAAIAATGGISSSAGSFSTGKSGSAATSADGMLQQNTTSATSGTPNQWTTRLRSTGRVWNTSGTPASNIFEFLQEGRSTSGSTPSSKWFWASALYASSQVFTDNMSLDNSGNLALLTGTVILHNYTVAGLPTGVSGMTAYVTDSLTPSFGVTVVGGGSTVTKVFYNGTNWICE